MSRHFQQLIAQGFLGADPVLRYTPDGKAVTNFNLASSYQYKNQAGDAVAKTTWYRVSVWGPSAEAVNKYCQKGSQVLVVGTLNSDENGRPAIFTTKDGKSSASYDVMASNVTFLDRKDAGQGEAQTTVSVNDDDIPF